MSVGFNVFLHLIFVLLCVGLGYVLRWSLEEFKDLDQQIARMKKPDNGNAAPLPQTQSLKNMGSALQSKADPNKLTELKASLKK